MDLLGVDDETTCIVIVIRGEVEFLGRVVGSGVSVAILDVHVWLVLFGRHGEVES